MIHLSDNKTLNNICTSKQQLGNKSKILINKNDMNSDSVSFSGSQPIKDKSQDKNKLIAFVVGGLVLLGGIILLIKRCKTSSSEIKKGTNDLGKKATENVKNVIEDISPNDGQSTGKIPAPENHHNPVNPASTPESNSTSIKQQSGEIEKQIEIQKGDAEKIKKEVNVLQEQKTKLETQLEQQQRNEKILRQNEEKVITEIIEKISPKDKELAKEVLPTLIEYSKPLMIDDNKKMGEFLEKISAENKDFVINEGIPLITKNIDLIDKNINDIDCLPDLLSCLNPINKDLFKPLLESTTKIDLDSIRSFGMTLKMITPKNKDLLLNIIESPEKFNIKDFSGVLEYLQNLEK